MTRTRKAKGEPSHAGILAVIGAMVVLWLVFGSHRWADFLPVGSLWGTIVVSARIPRPADRRTVGAGHTGW